MEGLPGEAGSGLKGDGQRLQMPRASLAHRVLGEDKTGIQSTAEDSGEYPQCPCRTASFSPRDRTLSSAHVFKLQLHTHTHTHYNALHFSLYSHYFRIFHSFKLFPLLLIYIPILSMRKTYWSYLPESRCITRHNISKYMPSTFPQKSWFQSSLQVNEVALCMCITFSLFRYQICRFLIE